MPDKKEFIIFILLCLIALGLGYWYGMPDKPSEERAEAGTLPAPTVVTNVVTNVLKEVVTNIVAANPQPTPAPVKSRPTPANIVPANTVEAILERRLRRKLNQIPGLPARDRQARITDLEKYVLVNLHGEKLTEVPKGLGKLPQLRELYLDNNKLTNVKGLEKLTQLTHLSLRHNKLTSVKGLEKLTPLALLGAVGLEFMHTVSV